MRRALALGGCVLAASFSLWSGPALADPPQQPAVSPTDYKFGQLCGGRTSPAKTFTISNNNTGNPMDVSISRDGDQDFSATAPSPSTIEPGGTSTFKVTFTPIDRGPRSATFTVRSSNYGDSAPVTVSGTGIDRRLSADRSPVSFGNQRVGTRSPTQDLLIRNLGGDPVAVTGISRHGTNGADFLVAAPAVPFTVAAGGARTVTIAFQPSGVGARSGSVEFDSNACASPSFRVALLGTGVEPNIVVQPSPIDAGASPVGKPGALVPVTVSNDGGAPLKISAIQVLGVNAVDFELTGLPPMPVTVPARGSFVFNVRMTPRAAGLRTATINVLSDDRDTPSFAVALSGTGGAPTASPSATPRPSPGLAHSPTASPSASPVPRKLGGSPSDSLAVGLVVGGVLAAFVALIVIRGLVGQRDED